jgi:plasmid maintenance system antidote protein VapI
MTSAKLLSPGQTLEALLRDQGYNQTEAASKIGITRQYLNSVIHGKLPLTTELQWKIKPVLGKGLEFWSDVSNKYDSYLKTPEGLRGMLEQREDDLVQQFDLHGQHALVNYEVEAAVEAQMIQLTSVDGRNLFRKENLSDTLYQLSFSDEAKVTSIDPTTRELVTQFVRTQPHYDLLPGQWLTMPTAEIVSLSNRVRMQIHGLCDPFPAEFVKYNGPLMVEPRNATQPMLLLHHGGFKSVRISHGSPALLVSFDYLAAEPARPARNAS